MEHFLIKQYYTSQCALSWKPEAGAECTLSSVKKNKVIMAETAIAAVYKLLES